MTPTSHFRAGIAAWGAAHNLTVTNGRGKRGRSLHLVQISTTPRPTTVYVKESNTARKFWGLTRNHVDNYRVAGARWFAVLLQSPGVGYVLTGGQVLARIHDGTFELGRDGEYKVNERQDLAAGQRFRSLDEVFDRIF